MASALRLIQNEPRPTPDRQDLGGGHHLIAASPAMRELASTARRAAGSDATVLLLGETGTGKEVLARAVHAWSPRTAGPFVAVNCGALTATLQESELFGHEEGAFTGATATRPGLFEQADGGTLFLDEVGELAPELQVKLLRALQEKAFRRVGGSREIRADVRIVAATNRDLRAAVERGAFREDLYYRLHVVALTVPALRERSEDVAALAHEFAERHGRALSSPAEDRLLVYTWPGNVRELENAIERAAALSRGSEIEEDALPPELLAPPTPADGTALDRLPLGPAVDEFKRMRIRRALEAADGNQTRAARALGIHQPNLSRLMKSLGIRSGRSHEGAARDRSALDAPDCCACDARSRQLGRPFAFGPLWHTPCSEAPHPRKGDHSHDS